LEYYFITGTSRGIGKALTEYLLKEESSIVFGFSRGRSISHPNYFHVPLDLTDMKAVCGFVFPEVREAESICLINNAAMISEIIHLGKLSSESIVTDYNASLIAPTVLCNQFLRQYQGYGCSRIIINVSSGAAQRPIESWAAYCSSKAGLEMVSRLIDVEQKLKHPANPVRVFSVMPGVVDTKMQEVLRSVSEEMFSEVQKFIDYKTNNELLSPQSVAAKLHYILKNPDRFEDVLLHVKDIEFQENQSHTENT
jgi:benzil reductase ((S)-benzoin forming)